ncbi:calcium/sodium antiporter [Shewanella marisflavi]|uniref:Sodium:calcium antiporter n=1 Tax=Shewanella marisflavi TaxID=260364 RepID=A0AAC9U4P0_9GAMM|nr:calcium/sodium antiporter [Shewanella marisflavi]ASJ98191.1 sodium:calcium antiporter [Shewanella marisflavi]
MFTPLALIAGLLILILGAESLVRGASALALRLGVTPLVIGLTIVAFGTSTPELAVSLKSAIAGNADIALGNVVGSNIANIGLILGLTALVRPVGVQSQMVKRDIPLMLFSTLLFCGLLSDGGLSRLDGALLASMLVAFLAMSYLFDRQQATKVEETSRPLPPLLSMLLVALGIGMLVGGGALFVDGAVALATQLGMSELLIGLTIVAIGTSMPELITSVVAARRGESDIAIGNLVGSNLFNLLGILGITALIQPINASVPAMDLLVMVTLALLLLPLAWSGLRIGRREGALLLLCYLIYLSYLILSAQSV